MKKKILLFCMIFSCLFAVNCFASFTYTYNKQEYTITHNDEETYPYYLIYNFRNYNLGYNRYIIVLSKTPLKVTNASSSGSGYVAKFGVSTSHKSVSIDVSSFPVSGNLDDNLTLSNTNRGTVYLYPTYNTSYNTNDVIVASNYDVINSDTNEVFFQPSVPRTLEEILKEEPQQIQVKIWETLKTIVPIAIVVLSMLLLVLLIRYHLL